MHESVSASITDHTKDDPATAVARALAQSGFWVLLENACREKRLDPARFRILILPDLAGFTAESSAATDPRLVESLVDLLHQRGFASVDLAASADSSSLWAENRDILALADLLGYRFVTEGGHAYDFVDLSQGLTRVALPPGSLLHGGKMAKAWLEADWRISFAKNKTDELNGFALGLANLFSTLPRDDKDYFYRHRWDAAEVGCELLKVAPIDFALIDALTSVHGSGGTRAPKLLRTNTIVASSSLLLTDFVAALKMGEDPYRSALNRKALTEIGLPGRYEIDGNLGPYVDWQRVSPLVSESVRLRESSVTASRALKPWLQVLDPELFPLKHPIDAQVNRKLAPLFADLDDDKGAEWLFILANYLSWYVQNSLDVYATLQNKDGLRRREVPLGFDPGSFTEQDYEEIAAELLPLADLVSDLEPDRHGLRWRYLGNAVVFEYARTVPVEFDEFVAKVDVSRTIQFMYDYIGGVVVPVKTDARDRPVHQAERNLYLPQPNYLVLHQGDVIDVSKLELVEYGTECQRLFWKTIKSENLSAEYDDGIASFSREPGGTRVSITGRQQFNLPPYWQFLNLDMSPELKDFLVNHAYRTFFRRTIANLEALVEGRAIAIGRPWASGTTENDTEALPAERLEALFNDLMEKYGDRISTDIGALFTSRDGSLPRPDRIDQDGFRHFGAESAKQSAASSRTAPEPVEQQVRNALDRIGDFSAQFAQVLLRDLRAGSRAGEAEDQ